MFISTYEIRTPRLLGNRDILHKLVMLMFNNKRSEEKVLFAVTGTRLIVQSLNKPQKSPKDLKLISLYDTSTMLDKFSNGSILTMYSVFEPTVCCSGNKKNLIRNCMDRIDWVNRKFNEFAEVMSVNEVAKDDIKIVKNSGDERRTSLFGYVIKIKIEDIDMFKKVLVDGIGRSKAYGAGLNLIMNAS